MPTESGNISVNQEVPQMSFARLPACRRSRTVFLASPYGQAGGGMGSFMRYLLARGGDDEGRFRFRALDTRGNLSLAFSPILLAWALLRIAAGRLSGTLALVHVNLAERGSVVRKGALLAWAKLLGVPVVLHLHAAQLMAHYYRLPSPMRRLVRAMFRAADECIVLGTIWSDWLTGEMGVPPARVHVIYNGIPDMGVRRPPGARQGPLRLLFLGNLLQRKGLTDLLAALSRADLSALDWNLTVAGGGDINFYRSEAERRGIGPRVRFTGWVDHAAVRQCLANADTLILPSYDEGLPLVILEALATGVPVICSPVGSIPEVLQDGHTALLVPAGDIKGLADCIMRLAGNPGLQESLAAAGRELYERLFTMETFAARVATLHTELDEARHGRRRRSARTRAEQPTVRA